MHEGSRKAILAALAANMGIAAAKFVGFAFTGAASMLAEGVHSVADSGNQALLLLGGARAQKAATPEHPFGYGRERYFWAFVVALVLFSLGGAFALYEGIEKLLHPHEVTSLGWAVGILGLAMVLEGFSFRTAVHEANPLRGDVPWLTFIRRSKSPELPVVLLEDFGALIGLVLAMGGVITAHVTGNPRYDAIGSIAIGLLLSSIAIVLAIEMKGLLIGESASPERLQTIADEVAAAPSVTRLIHIRTEHLGPDELLVAAKVEFATHLSVPELALAIDEVERRVRRVAAAEHHHRGAWPLRWGHRRG